MGNSDAYTPKPKSIPDAVPSVGGTSKVSNTREVTCSCGGIIKEDSVICLSCGRQLRPLKVEISQPQSNEEVESSFSFWGTFFALVIPYIGFLLGLIGLATGRRRAGFVVGLSLILMAVYTFILMYFINDPYSFLYY